MQFKQIRNSKLSEKVIQQLIQSIRSGGLPLDTRLPPEADLAKQLGVSRGILREALTVLEVRGYISRSPKEGTYVRSVRDSEPGQVLSQNLRQANYRDLLELREAMEFRVVEKVIYLATDQEIYGLFALLTDDDSTPDKHTVDYYFHYRLAELSGNPLFANFLDMYYDTIREMKNVSLRNADRLPAMYQEHTAIVEAIRKRDVKAAQDAVSFHFRNVEQSLSKREFEDIAP